MMVGMARPPYSDSDAEEPAPETAEVRRRARRVLRLLIRCYLFGAAVTLLVLVFTADLSLGQLALDTLFWPSTLGEIARSL